MSRPSIIVDDLSKAYRIGLAAEKLPTFREAIMGTIKSPLRHLRRFGEKSTRDEIYWALRHVSFEVQPGEVVGIIGRNGAGKSTLLKILSRITEPTEGCARLRGRVASLLEVGTGFHPELTGRENVYLNGSILGMRKAEIDLKFDEIVAFAEIERFVDTPVKHYSSGMYVRLAFAVAAHLEPEVLVVDEVLAVGDGEFQKRCLGKMHEISQGGGRTVLFVSHNMGAVRTLCTACCVLRHGNLVFSGDVQTGVEFYTRECASEGLTAYREFAPPDTGNAWMRSAGLFSEGKVAEVIPMGGPIVLSVEFASSSPVRQPKLGFCIDNEMGYRVLQSSNRYQPSEGPSVPCTEGVVTCDLGVVPLMPGRYTVSLWFGGFAGDTHVVESALSFEVVERDIWGMGQVPSRKWAMMWWPTKYIIHAK